MSDFNSKGQAWVFGESLRGESARRVSQRLAIAVVSAARANGENLSGSLGGLAHDIEAILTRYGVGTEPRPAP